jgi:hypothetical protein
VTQSDQGDSRAALADARKRVERFLIGQFRNEPEGGTNAGGGEIVLALKLFKGHTAGQATDHRGYRDPRAANNQPAMAGAQLACPADISIAGYNDMPFAGRFSPSLTTLRIPHNQIGVQSSLGIRN